MFYNGVFPAQVFPDQVFPDAPSADAIVAMVDLVGALNLQTAFGGALTLDRPIVSLVGSLNIQMAFGGTIDTVAPQPPPDMIDLTGAVNLTVTFSGALVADNAGWIRRTSDGESWTVVH